MVLPPGARFRVVGKPFIKGNTAMIEIHETASDEWVVDLNRNGSSLAPPMCSRHPDEATKFWCHTCRALMCYRCALYDHRSCAHGEIQPTYDERVPAMRSLVQEIEKREEALTNASEVVVKNLAVLEKHHEDARKALNATNGSGRWRLYAKRC